MKENYEQLILENSHFNTERLLLRPFTENDLQDVFEYTSDEETVKYLTWPAHTNMEHTLKIIRNYYINPYIYAIELKYNKKCIGTIDFRMDFNNDKAGFGYVLNRNYWNKGYMSEALFTLMEFYFEKLDINRIEATYYVGNEASGKVMEKCGMKYEGRGLQEVKVKGVYFDVEHYAIIRNSWNNLV